MSDFPSAILFSCTSNVIRSPMAAAIFRHFHGRYVFVDSAGVRKGEIDPFVEEVLEELGIDNTKHRPKTFRELEDSSFDLIISLSPEAHHQALEMTHHMACEVEFWRTFDPSLVEGSREMRLDAYREVRDQLLRKIKERFPLRPSGQT
jgi:protein-tyrosine-phosphatase